MLVFRAITRFCQSKDREVTERHVYIPIQDTPAKRNSKRRGPPSIEWVVNQARSVWQMITSGGLHKTFTTILKEFQLSKPDLSRSYHLIMLDEAQDIDDCQADIITMQTNCRVIVVGDPHQVRRGKWLVG